MNLTMNCPATERTLPEMRLLAIFDRLEAAIDRETAAMKSGDLSGVRQFVVEKTRGLLDLMQILRGASPGVSVICAERMRRLRQRLDGNRASLEIQMKALEQVSTILANAYDEAADDGIYDVRFRSGGV